MIEGRSARGELYWADQGMKEERQNAMRGVGLFCGHMYCLFLIIIIGRGRVGGSTNRSEVGNLKKPAKRNEDDTGLKRF